MNELQKIVVQENLSTEESFQFMMKIMHGEVSEIILSSFLTALRIKGETSEELLGFARAMRENAVKPSHGFDFEFLDNCGTGGDGKGSLNISTLSALTIASMGIKIAKHGNRSVSSLCGSSDLLSELGYKITQSHEEVEAEFRQKNFTFLFAPAWHPSMKYAANVRKELGFRTVFNMLGPLSNPFNPSIQIVGVYSADIMEKIMQVLVGLGIKKAIVCHSEDGLDEFSIFKPTNYYYYDGFSIIKKSFDPAVLGIFPKENNGFYCNTKEESVGLAKKVLSGEEISGLYGVALNSGVAVYLSGMADSIEEGYKKALLQLKNGNVNSYIKQFIS